MVHCYKAYKFTVFEISRFLHYRILCVHAITTYRESTNCILADEKLDEVECNPLFLQYVLQLVIHSCSCYWSSDKMCSLFWMKFECHTWSSIIGIHPGNEWILCGDKSDGASQLRVIGKAVSILLFGKEISNRLLCPCRGYTSVHMLWTYGQCQWCCDYIPNVTITIKNYSTHTHTENIYLHLPGGTPRRGGRVMITFYDY